MKINYLDLFSGIGGFTLGLLNAGFEFNYHGFSEIDKYSIKTYKRRFKDAKGLGSITDIQCEDLPKDIDLLCGGFPCQAFSQAGLRRGFEDTRGTLFFEIVRILRHYKKCGKPINNFILENVKGLLSHDDGRTFAIIYRVLADIGYDVECQLLNTRWFLPQNRERIYIVGHFRKGCRPKIFPITKSSGKTQETSRVSDYTRTITTAHAHGTAKHMSYVKPGLKQIGVIDKDSEATRVYDPSGIARTIKDGGGMGAKTGLYVTNLQLRGEKERARRKTKITENYDGVSFAVDPGNNQALNSIRRLTPTECERLQGFPDGWTEGQSDTQRYRQLGNAVSVPVVQAIAERLITII